MTLNDIINANIANCDCMIFKTNTRILLLFCSEIKLFLTGLQ